MSFYYFLLLFKAFATSFISSFFKTNLLVKFARQYHVTHVFDIGANVGQFSISLIASRFPGYIYSFEPIPLCYKYLSFASSLFRRWHTYNYAISNNDDPTVILNISNNFVSSSILKVSSEHLSHEPETCQKSLLSVPALSLRASYEKIFQGRIYPRSLLKLDIQGFEHQVLSGQDLYSLGIILVLVEVSYRKLYHDQVLSHDIFSILYNQGFVFVAYDGHYSSSDSSLLQSDALFVHSSQL